MSISTVATTPPTVIAADTIWNDPFYIVSNSSVVVLPNVTLTIQGTVESPVRVEFERGRSAINLQSFANVIIDNVHFVGHYSEPLNYRPEPLNLDNEEDDDRIAGLGIQYLTNDRAFASISGLRCSNMTQCLNAKGSGNLVNVSNSIFENCNVGITESLRHKEVMDFNVFDSAFQGNAHGFSSQRADGPKIAAHFHNCAFLSNYWGVYCGHSFIDTGSQVQVANSIFADNGRAVILGRAITAEARSSLFLRNKEYAVGGLDRVLAGKKEEASIQESVFAYNGKAIDVFARIESSVFMHNRVGSGKSVRVIYDSVFYRNEVGAMGSNIVNKTSFVENGIAFKGSGRTMVQSNFLDSRTYHVEQTSSDSWSATNLYWGTTDIDEIRTKIYDVYQNASLGLVTIEPVADNLFEDAWDWEPLESFLGVDISNDTGNALSLTRQPTTMAPFAPSRSPALLDPTDTAILAPTQGESTQRPLFLSSSPIATTSSIADVSNTDILQCHES